MGYRTTVTAKIAVQGLHYWSTAPEHISYLRNPHRHVFVIRCEKGVHHDDRDVEFITFGHMIENYLLERFYNEGSILLDFGDHSCERIARILLDEFDLVSCSVFEDGENGATVRVARKEIR